MNPETRIHIAIVKWWDYAAAGYKLDRRLLHHSPNGGKRGKIEGSLFKAMGLRAGFSDLILTVPCHGNHGLMLEVKSPSGRISPEQKEILKLHEGQGYAVAVAWNTNEGISCIINYLRCGDPFSKS